MKKEMFIVGSQILENSKKYIDLLNDKINDAFNEYLENKIVMSEFDAIDNKYAPMVAEAKKSFEKIEYKNDKPMATWEVLQSLIKCNEYMLSLEEEKLKTKKEIQKAFGALNKLKVSEVYDDLSLDDYIKNKPKLFYHTWFAVQHECDMFEENQDTNELDKRSYGGAKRWLEKYRSLAEKCRDKE